MILVVDFKSEWIEIFVHDKHAYSVSLNSHSWFIIVHSQFWHPIAIFKWVMLGSLGWPVARICVLEGCSVSSLSNLMLSHLHPLSPPQWLYFQVMSLSRSLAEYQFTLCGLSYWVISFSASVFVLALACIRVMHTLVDGEKCLFSSTAFCQNSRNVFVNSLINTCLKTWVLSSSHPSCLHEQTWMQYNMFLHSKPWIPSGEKSIFTVVNH